MLRNHEGRQCLQAACVTQVTHLRRVTPYELFAEHEILIIMVSFFVKLISLPAHSSTRFPFHTHFTNNAHLSVPIGSMQILHTHSTTPIQLISSYTHFHAPHTSFFTVHFTVFHQPPRPTNISLSSLVLMVSRKKFQDPKRWCQGPGLSSVSLLEKE